MAEAKECFEGLEFPPVSRLLQVVCRRIFEDCYTDDRVDKEESEVRLVREVCEQFPRVEAMTYYCTCTESSFGGRKVCPIL